jgi:hypothetical protein
MNKNKSDNLLRDAWADLDQMDLRLLLKLRIGQPGQFDGSRNIIYLPLAREKCKIALRFKGTRIVAITPGRAFDPTEWNRIVAEIEGPILGGARKFGREFSFSSAPVDGWWRGKRSRVQILPPPRNAPRHRGSADDPFILQFPIQDAGEWQITNQRRRREHQRLTLLLNLLLRGTITFLPDRRKSFWGHAQFGDIGQIMWLQENYFANPGKILTAKLSAPRGEKLEEIEPEKYYSEFGVTINGLCVPQDLDDSIWRYQNLLPNLQSKFDRSIYWLNIAGRQWEVSMSASFAALVSAAEALTCKSIKHQVYCHFCEKGRPHDVPGAGEKFRNLFERYAPGLGRKKRRGEIYDLRSGILHGSDLMLLDQGRAFGWDPPWFNEREINIELWSLMRTAARNWLKDPT